MPHLGNRELPIRLLLGRGTLPRVCVKGQCLWSQNLWLKPWILRVWSIRTQPRVLGFATDLVDTLDGKQRLLEALRKNPNLLKQFRPILEETLEEKLESMGVKRVSTRRREAKKREGEEKSSFYLQGNPFFPGPFHSFQCFKC